MAIVTVLGATGNTHITVTVDGSHATALTENFSNNLLKTYSDRSTSIGQSIISHDGSLITTAARNYGAIVEGGQFFVNQAYTDVVIGKENTGPSVSGATPGTPVIPFTSSGSDAVLDVPVTVISGAAQNSSVNVLAGSASNVTYYAHYENGTIIGASGSLTYYGSNEAGKAGSYSITTSETGQSTVYLGLSSNIVYAQGQDRIVGPFAGNDTALDQGYAQSVTLSGSSHSSLVQLGSNASVYDSGINNTIEAAGHSSIILGVNAQATLVGAASRVEGGENSTISATSDALDVIHGLNNSITTSGSLTFYNGAGNTTVTAANSTIFGASNLNLKYDVTGDDPSKSFFVASAGNETLDGSASHKALTVFTTLNGNLTVTGSAYDDFFVGGPGNATFTGGAGSNTYYFKDGYASGNNVITDFNASSGNKIWLDQYNLTNQTLQTILDSATTLNHNTTIKLADQTQITFSGLDNLSVNDFKLS